MNSPISRPSVAAFALLLSGAAVPAAAQAGGGEAAVPIEPIAVEAMHNFSACIVNRNPQAASEVLGMDFRERGYHQALGRLARGHDMCAANSKLKFNDILLAGGMAEALLDRRGFAQLPARLAYREGDTAVEARSDTEYAGLCLVRKAPDAVSALLATEPAGPAELTKFRPITELLPSCIRKGLQVRFNRPGLRAVVALAAYRLAQTHAEAN